ncbi:hypothetical protein HCJ58_10100 [Listeria sp. FSL L7-1509]|uniref:Lipoprotein n=1 Tax=Listeria immobilis TaxID=2713502 RepID=A0ABR6SYC8_9LIST|nr:hypothetical protein [Listeria immobilis]MBC1481935.1 hypothetical protein [Listeria immobilis]MBC1507310.1 hypothetical protein [Listeria immobilis]MBC1510624.1 hypothetical protein [Listeria immobilis]MBC6313170.1 hypothetical protein [Listeria immobilis]
MKKLILMIICMFCILVACSEKDIEKDTPFGLEKIKGNFAYGEVYKINKKKSESAILRMSDDKMLFGIHDRATRDFSFYWLGLDQKIQKTKSMTVSENVGDKDDQLFLGVEGSKEIDVRNDNASDTIGIINFSGVYFDFLKGDFIDKQQNSVELKSGKQLMSFTSMENSIKDGTFVIWNKTGKIESQTSISKVLENPQASSDSIGVFGKYIYVFSKETKTIYQLTNELQVVKKYNLSAYLSKDKLGEWNTGEFIYQNELKKCIFYLKEENGEGHYFDVTTDNITPWDFSNPDYKDKYAIHGPNLINLNDENADYNLKTARLSRAAGEGITANGDYYFLSSKNLTEEKPKEEALYTRYLIKVEKDKLKSFLEEYGKKNN